MNHFVLFNSNNCLKDILLQWSSREKHQILTFEKSEPAMVFLVNEKFSADCIQQSGPALKLWKLVRGPWVGIVLTHKCYTNLLHKCKFWQNNPNSRSSYFLWRFFHCITWSSSANGSLFFNFLEFTAKSVCRVQIWIRKLRWAILRTLVWMRPSLLQYNVTNISVIT